MEVIDSDYKLRLYKVLQCKQCKLLELMLTTHKIIFLLNFFLKKVEQIPFDTFDKNKKIFLGLDKINFDQKFTKKICLLS